MQRFPVPAPRRGLLLPLVLLATLAGVTGPCPGWDGPAPPRLAAVDSLLALGQARAAADLARSALRDEDVRVAGTWQWRERLAAALDRLGRPEEAIAQLESAIREAPQVPALHAALGRLLLRLGRGGRAVYELGQAADLAPDDWRLALDHGQALLSLDLTGPARTALQTAFRLCGRCPEAARALGGLELAAARYAAAVPPLRALNEAHPSPWSRRALALCLLRTGAAAEVQALLAPLWPDSLSDEGRIILLEADRSLGEMDRALAAAQGPAPAGASDRFWSLTGILLLETDHPGQALLALDRALSLAPRDTVSLNNRIVALERMGRHEEARRLWEQLHPTPAPPGGGRP